MEPIKCTMGDVVKAMKALEKLRKVDLPVGVSLELRRIHKEVEREFDLFLEEEKIIIENNAERDEKGGFVNPPLLNAEGQKVLDDDGNEVLDLNRVAIHDMDIFSTSMDQLKSQPVELNARKLPLHLIENVEITYDDADALAFLVEL